MTARPIAVAYPSTDSAAIPRARCRALYLAWRTSQTAERDALKALANAVVDARHAGLSYRQLAEAMGCQKMSVRDIAHKADDLDWSRRKATRT